MSHYYSEDQDSRLRIVKREVVLRGMGLDVIFGSGTFSSKKLDFGTKVLANNMLIRERDDVLDLGCGNGVVGMVASLLTKGEIVLTDINKRAVKLAEANNSSRKNVEVLQGNMFEPVNGRKFDVILLNPPQTAGKKVCFGMIEKSKEYLKDNGSLQLVARHNKGGRTLSENMEEVFGNMETLVKKGGYRVYLSRKSI
ncbi:MAG: methyltransferase [Candidatus Woesearchaeota archaeon]